LLVRKKYGEGKGDGEPLSSLPAQSEGHSPVVTDRPKVFSDRDTLNSSPEGSSGKSPSSFSQVVASAIQSQTRTGNTAPVSFAREVLHTVKQGRETRTAEGSPPGSDAEISGASRSPSLNEGSSSVVRAIQEVKSITRKELERREEAHLEAHHHPTHLDDVEEVNDDE